MEDQRLYLPVFDIYFSNSVVKLFILFDVGPYPFGRTAGFRGMNSKAFCF